MTGLAQRCVVAVDGVLIVRKEAGWTSHDVVAKIRRLLGGGKVGHAGTLDPAATGVLPALLGKGTRIAEYLVEWDKEYRAVLRLGETTDTQDATGTVLTRRATEGVTPAAIHEAAGRFRGTIEQLPPMYSAIKVGGVPLYKSAREGKTVERKVRTVLIHHLDVLAIEGRDVTLRVVCSKGTYVRTLCADIGESLGVGGHLLSLERSRVGTLTLEQALTVEDVATHAALGTLAAKVVSMTQALEGLPAAVVGPVTASRVLHGVPVPTVQIIRWILLESGALESPGAPLRILDGNGRLLAVGRYPESPGAQIDVEKVLVDRE
jgi:tRNA pseudouridine55 synthase